MRVAVLTNSPLATAQAQLDAAQLTSFFEAVLSVDEIKRFKPAPEPYLMAAERLGVAPGEMRLVAAHAWDIAGAAAVGCQTAFVARPGQVLNPLGPMPDVEGVDLREIAPYLLQADRPQ